MKQFWNLTQNKEGGNTLEILHEIAQETSCWWDVTSSNRFRSDLMQCSGDMQVVINSPGGDVFAAADMYTVLRQYAQDRGHVTCVISGLAGSAASMVAMAGDTIKISPVGTIMIHNPWTGLSGNASELRQMADVLDTLRDGMAHAYMRKTGKSRAEIADLMAKETWMNAEQAVADGFADEIVDDGGANASAGGWRYAAASMVEKICAAVKDEGLEKILPQMQEIAKRISAEMGIDPACKGNTERERAALQLKMMCL